VKHKEDGSRDLTPDGHPQFEPSALPAYAEARTNYLNVLKALAPYQSATLKAIDVGLGVSTREMVAPAEPKMLPSPDDVERASDNDAAVRAYMLMLSASKGQAR
jgi:hypothetical protein